MISHERERTRMSVHTHTHTHTPLPGALDAPPQSNLFTLSRCRSCRRWGGSRLQSRKLAPEDKQADARGGPGSGTAAPPGAPGSPPPLPPPRRRPRPGARSPGRQRWPTAPTCGTRAVREGSGPEPAPTLASGRPRSASPWSCGRGHREQSAQERGGKGHAARGESRAGSERARPPAHPACKARSPRGARRARCWRPGPGRGLLQGDPGTARSPAGQSPLVRRGLAPAQRRRNARPSGRGGTGGVTTLKGSAPLVKAPPGHSEIYVFGARGCLSWSLPLPSLPFSAVGLLFSTPSCTESSCVF